MKNEIIKALTAKKNYRQHMLLHAEPGYGKSTTTVKAVLSIKKIPILVVVSNAAVMEKAEQFRNMGYVVQTITSTEYNLAMDHKICVKRLEATTPFDFGRIGSNDQVLKEIMRKGNVSEEEANTLLQSSKPAQIDYENNQIIIMTYTGVVRARRDHSLNPTKVGIHENAVLILDDLLPIHITNLLPITEFNKEFRDSKVDGKPIDVVHGKYFINNQFYVVPHTHRIDYGLENKIIWTTTENMIADAIKNLYKPIVIDRAPKRREIDGKVDVITTKLIRHRTDGVITMMIEAINAKQRRKDNKIMLFGNGMFLKNTLTKIRGRDDLQSRDIVTKISQPNTQELMPLGEVLGTKNLDQLKKMSMTDSLLQAAGRNRGIRYISSRSKKTKSSTSIMLVDPIHWEYIKEHCPVNFGRVVELKDDGKITNADSSDTFAFLCYLMNNPTKYITGKLVGIDRRRLLSDYVASLEHVKKTKKKLFSEDFEKILNKLIDDIIWSTSRKNEFAIPTDADIDTISELLAKHVAPYIDTTSDIEQYRYKIMRRKKAKVIFWIRTPLSKAQQASVDLYNTIKLEIAELLDEMT